MIDVNKLMNINPNSSHYPYRKMSFDDFYDKMQSVLPNFPKDVLDQWPYEAFLDFINQVLEGVAVDRLCFERESWPTEKIMLVRDPSDFYECGVGLSILQGPFDTPLLQYMHAHYTWPRPIIILDTINSKSDDNYNYLMPYHLLEGHLRLVYLQRLVDAGAPVEPTHTVWKAILK